MQINEECMMRQILLYIFISFFACSLCAEQFKITGKVVDTSENNEPLIAATVEIKGTDRSTFTDIDGNFSIEVEKAQSSGSLIWDSFPRK